ncbi:hypothetical protein RHGRI_036789 [Rhododendron griersonianum]|uniref:Uncharacterized protein n=1 Tax=Rhododendron griersonianum TaxID=479676 RepID=A0AAV6HSH8_9ERIC|nr:hypothetical protein RHGRI_036789 [Rhododendron griersonianum]
MVKSEVESVDTSKGRRIRWAWPVAAALVAVLLAIALASRGAPTLSLLDLTTKRCPCAPGTHTQSGIVEDCCCDYETVDHLNEEVLDPLLQELVKTPFFRYFKVKLWCDCPFWPDDGMCILRDCSVCECPEHEFPEPLKRPSSLGLSSDDLVCREGKPEAAVDRTLDTKTFRGWIEIDNPWTNDDETDNGEMTYVNLQLNPERYTGYTGPSPRRIWDAIYTENCHKYPSGEFCQEKKILYKLISGLHASISIHIAAGYLLDEATNLWGQNLTLLYDRVLRYPDRVSNLYFTFLFVLRAVTKAADYLEQAEYDTGNPEEDLKTQSLMRQLLYNPKIQAACPLPFDEAKLWKGQGGPELKQQIQRQFRNIRFPLKSFALMDCVGCEKCRLWGKLQVLGLGTALKILFSGDGQENLAERLQLQRNEVIALMNLLNRLSESVKFIHKVGPGPSISKTMGGPLSVPTNLRPLLRLWTRLFGQR